MGARKFASKYPDYVFVMTNGGCNGRCGYCPHGKEGVVTPRGRMSWDLLTRIADDLATFKPPRVGLFLNNEPLLDKRLPDIVNLYRKKIGSGPELVIISNGFFMSEAMFRGLHDAGLDRIKISFQSLDAETYEKIVGIPFQRPFDNIMRALEIKKKEGWKKPKIEISTVVIELNEHEIAAMKRFWRKHGVKATASPCTNYGGKIKENKIYYPFGLKGGVEQGYCVRMERELNIMLDGRACLCCYDWSGEVVLGDVNQQTLEEIWQGTEARRIRENIRRGDFAGASHLCAHCGVSRYPARHHRNLRGLADRLLASINRLKVWGTSSAIDNR